MEIKRLTKENLKDYIKYLNTALSEEPEQIMTDSVDEKSMEKALSDNSPELCKSLVAYEGGRLVGSLEYHFYICLQDSCKMAYVDWVYTLKPFRQRGVAKSLFCEFERLCLENGVKQYFLIQADNSGASGFYSSFRAASSAEAVILRKTIL